MSGANVSVEYEAVEYEGERDRQSGIRVTRGVRCPNEQEALRQVLGSLPRMSKPEETRRYRLRRVGGGRRMRLGPRFKCKLDLARIAIRGGHFPVGRY